MSILHGDMEMLPSPVVGMVDRLAVSENMLEDGLERSLTDDSFYDGVDPSRFLKLDRLGEGQYATVYRAKSLTENNKIVAIKYLRMLSAPEHRSLTGISDLHEVEILSRLCHPNIVRFLDYFCQGRQKAVVLEFMDFSLDTLLKEVTCYPVPLPQVTYYVGSMTRGLAYLHEQNVVHRDLKPNNILVNRAGEVKIGDFGCSRRQDTAGDARYSRQFACRSYRPPEIILSTRVYNQTVDTWALGCIVAEFYRKGPLFVGTSDIEQIFTISRTLGSPRPEDYRPDQISGIQLKFPVHQYLQRSITDLLPAIHAGMATLLDHCLVYDIDRRWTSQLCLDFLLGQEAHFPPCLPQELFRPASCSKPVRRINSKRKLRAFDDPDTSSSSSNCDDLDISVANLQSALDGAPSDGSSQSPPQQSKHSHKTFPQSKFSATKQQPFSGPRKKLCF